MTKKRITCLVILLCMLLSMFNLPLVSAANVDTADTGAQTDVAQLGANVSDGTIIYFDASNYAASGSVVQFMIGHDSWSQGYPMTKVSNSNLYYVKMATWEGASQYAIFGCNEEWGGEGSSVSNRKNWAPWSTSVMSAVNLSGTVVLTANSSGTLSKSSASLNTTQTATACYRDSNSGSYSTGTTGGTVSVSGYNISGSSSSSKSSSTSGTGISAGISTTVTMKATAKTGYTFQGWYSSTSATSAVSTSSTFTYVNTGSATTYYAKFQLNGPYTVTASSNNTSYGTVSAGSTSVYYGKTTTLTATPKTGYYFSKWAVNNSSYGTLSSTTATSPTLTVYNNVTATATFTAISAKVTFSAGTGGTVSSTGGSTSGTGSKSSTATANTGYTFTGWTISGGTLNADYKITSGSTSSNSITIQPLKNGAAITAKATFSETAYSVTVKSNNTSYGTVSPTSASAGYGDTKTLTATPKSGYHFTGWSLNSSSYGKLSSTTATSTTLTVYNNVTVTGSFAANSGKVTFSAGTGGSVSSTGGTTSTNGSKSSTATANAGYNFSGWTISGGTLNTDYKITSGSTSSTSITIQTLTNGAAITAKANFKVKTYTVTFKDWDGTTLATRTVNHGSAATAPTSPTRTGYTFTGWDKTFSSITANTTVTALYSINTYTVTFKDWDGSTLATRTVNYGSAATAPTDPTRSGYQFTGWDKTFSNVTSNLTVTALYKDVRVWLPGSFNSWDTTSKNMTQNSNGTYSITLTLDPGTYQFKVLTEDVWYGNYGTIEDTTTATSSVGWEMVDGHGDCTLQASGGTYKFTFNKSTRMLVVDYTPIKYTVTFKNWDGSTLKTETVAIGQSATAPSTPSRTATAQYTYTFSGWDKDFTNVQSDLTVTAQFKSTVNKYTVTFKNWDGTVLSTQSVAYGSNATPPSDPVKEGDSQYAYTFTGWDGSYENIKADTVLTATYSSSTNKYKVTFKDYDGTVLVTRTVAYGANATPPSNPTRTGYTFAGWSGNYKNITADTTVTATYTVAVYTVTFKDWDGTVLKTQSVNYGSAATAPSNPTRTGYTFKAWDKTFSKITADTTVTATYTINTYTVTFKDYDGSTLATRTVNYGSAATAPTAPTRSGYKFTGWDKDFSKVTANLTVTAQYSEIEVYLLGGFNDWASGSNSKMTLSSGNVYVKTVNLAAGSYEFKILSEDVWYGNYGTIEDTTTKTSDIGWEMVDGYGNCTLTASGGAYKFTFNLSTRMLVVEYAPTYYTVTFKNWDGTTISTQSVAAGSAATAPANPTRTGYTFKAWDKDFSNITADLTVTATYTINTYTVTFKDWDGTVLKTQSVNYGSAATAPSNPTRTGYTFKGWDKTFTNITANTTVTAEYNVNYYTVKFVDWDGTVLSSQSVAYGSSATPPADPTREGDSENTYLFAGWSGSYTNIKADTTITATYSSSTVTYTVTFKNYDGTVLATKTVPYGGTATAPTAPTRTGYTFTGWSGSYSNVTADTTVTATYAINTYTVTFKDYDGTVLATRTVNHGSAATAPTDPTRTGYTFTGWDKDFSNVTSNLTVTAQYSATEVNLVGDFNEWNSTSGKMSQTGDNVYTISLNLEAGTYKFKVIANDTWYGNWGTIEDTTTATSATGWEMDENADDCTLVATGGAYTFTYNTSTKMLVVTYKASTYTVTFKDYDGTTISTVTVNAGSAATAPADPTRSGYKFTGWDKDFSNVTSDLTVTAKYSKIEVNLVGDFNSWNTSTGNMTQSSGNIYSIVLNLEAGTYKFKVIADGTWMGNWGTIEDTTTATSSVGWEMDADADDCTLVATGGAYTFNYNISTKMLEVLYVSDGFVVTFKDYDGTILKTQKVESGSSATAPSNPTREGYTFTGWDKTFTNVTSNLTVTAKYSINYYTVKFLDWDGTVLSSQSIAYGSDATPPADPTRESVDGTTYTFSGWNGTYTNIKADTTITATYSTEEVYYKVTFVDWNGDVIKEQSVLYGSAATAPTAPTREGYTFKAWDKSFTKITSDLTVTATYTINSYTVTFKDYDGTVLATKTVDHGSAAEAPTAPTRSGYKFVGWDKEFSSVTSNLTVTAKYSEIEVTLVGDFNEWNSASGKMSMASDNVYTISLNLEAGTYKFKLVADGSWYGNWGTIEDTTTTTSAVGWEMDASADNCTLQASGGVYTFTYNTSTKMLVVDYEADGYVVTFKDHDGTTLKTEKVDAGKAATAPEAPTREGYTFKAWDKDFSNVTSNLTVTATYTINSYTVTFKDYDGKVLSTATVEYGSAATAPAAPTREGYTFKGWDKEFTSITADTTITALYDVYVEQDTNVYLAGSFNDWSTSTAMTVSGEIATLTVQLDPGTYLFKLIYQDVWYGNDGTIEDTTKYTSEIGWEMADGAGNCTLMATGGAYTFSFNTSTKMLEITCVLDYAPVTFKNWDGTILSIQNVKKGSAATAPADPTREADAQYTYTFAGWDTDFSNIQGETIVTATYTETLNKYTVTFVNDDGTVLKTEEVEYGSSATAPEEIPTKEGNEQCTYVFVGWDVDFSVITGDLTVTATYAAEGDAFKVTFVDWDGTVLSEQYVVNSTAAVAPEDPVREGDEEHSYVFSGWDKDFSCITEETVITATYTLTVNTYTVTFVNYDGSVLKTQLVAYGEAATAPATPSRPTTAQFRFTFDGWDTDFSCITGDTTVKATYTASVNGSGGSTGIYNLARDVQQGQILQAWCWSYDNVRKNLQTIASQGFSAVQVSPIQPIKESTRNGWNTLMNSSWVIYQPVAFNIETNSFNAQGTKSQFKSMCSEAHKYGVKIIVDVVVNHTANDMSGNTIHPWIPSDLKDNPDCWHDISKTIYNFDNRYDVTHYCLTGLPDLNTGHPTVQWHAANLLKEAIAAGADGFRFDAAKHIETDWDADGTKSDFWMNVLGEATSYAQSTRGFTPYYYGEILGSAGGGLSMSAYTRYMSITETSSNDIRYAITQGNAAGAVIGGLYQGESSYKAVMFTETHDTYKDSGTRFISDADINKTWAIVGSRANICGLYMARPYNIDTTLMGAADVTSWSYPEVKAVNQFKNHFVGQGEYLSSYYNLACVERGNSGIVIVNVGGTYYNGMSAPVHTMKDGYYKDAITGNVFTVSGGWISGDIGDTGIAVIYEAADKGTFTAGNPTDFSLVGTFNDWDSAANKFVASDDKSASTVIYLDKGTYTFKLTTDSGLWYSNAGTITDSTGNSPWSMYTNVSDDCTLVASGGMYTFTFNSVTGKLSVAYKATADYSSNMYLKGTFNDWGTGNKMTYTGKNNIVTTSLTLDAGTYTFKLNDTGYNCWYSNGGTINDTTAAGGSSGWDMSQYVSDDCTLVATGGTYTFNFNMGTHKLVVLHQPITHTVVFKDYDGTIITSQTVEHGAAAAAPDDPEREFDGTYAYIFSGWDKDFSNVTEDMVVVAQYTSAENSFAVIFKDWKGDVVSSQLVKVGEDAVAPADPIRPNNAQFTYEFVGWDKEFTNITEDTIVTALYNVITNQYTATFVDWDGTLIGTSTVDYGTSAVAPADPTREGNAQYSYKFTGWSKDFSKIVEDIEVTAVYEEITNQYTVTFKNWDGSTISTQSVNYGWAAQAPAAPTRDGYLFTGWDREYNYITGELTVYATFAEDIVYLKGDFNGWGTESAMTATENNDVVSVTLAIEAGTYGFKINRVYYWYGNGGTIEDTTLNTSEIGWGMSDSEDTNCTLKASGGYYTFRFNKATAYLEILHVPFAYTVTFVDYDGTVLKSEQVMRGEAATAPENPTRDGYAFTGWDKDFTNIAGDTTVTATYAKAGENEHIVTFVNWDETIIAQVIVEDGKSAEAPETPTKEGNAQYSYVFAGWDTDISKVTADMTVTATYTEVINSYAVTFVDFDGTVLSEQVVEYGSSAEAPEAPEREGDENTTYTFKGWDKDFTSITGILTVTAQYDVTYTKYTVTFVNWDGTVLSTQQVEYSKAATAPENPTRAGYLFTGWDTDFSKISGDLTVTATFAEDVVYLRGDFNDWGTNYKMTATGTDNVVSVTVYLEAGTYGFKINRVNDWYGNGGTIEDTTLNTSDKGWGMSATESANCTLKASGGYYTFSFNKETAYLTVLAAQSSYTVTFVDFDGTVLKTEVVDSGKSATAPESPVREGYVFTGWSADFSNITSDLTVMAVYAEASEMFVVTFKDWDGTVLATQQVAKGQAATAPEAPTRVGDVQYSFVFDGWDVDITNITADTTATAVYKVVVNSYTVTFVNYDGTVIAEQSVEYGSAAETPETPTRKADAQYSYIFKGWDKDFTNITGDLTVTAEYDSVINKYTVKFVDWDGTVLKTETVEYGKAATVPDVDPERETDDYYEYTFYGWDKDFSNVQSDMTITAQYYTTAIEYMVVFLDMEGNLIEDDIQYVMYGQAAVAPEPPVYEGYVFTGWDTDFSCIEADTIIFAEYVELFVYLPGSFNDWDTDYLMENIETPVAYTAMDLEPGTYTFKVIFNDTWYGNTGVIKDTTLLTSEIGWEMYSDAGDCTLEASGGTYIFEFNAQTKMLTVTSDVETFTVTFVDHNNEVIKTEVVRKGDTATAPEEPIKESDEQYTYTFAAWRPEYTNIQSDLTVSATYTSTLNTYTVTFVDYDGTVLSEQTVNYGSAAVAPEAPTREGYFFTGWDNKFAFILKDITITAQYVEDVTYLTGSFNEWSQDTEMTAGDTENVVSATLTLEAGEYEFQIFSREKWYGNTGVIENTTLNTSEVGWQMKEGANNCILKATGGTYTFNFNTETAYLEIIYVPITYTVTFTDWDGTVLKSETVVKGESATAPADPTREGYVFTGWSLSFDNIQADTEITATYQMEDIRYTVTFVDWDGTVIDTQEVVTGKAATAPKAPEREGYVFTGWDADFSKIVSDMTVTAQYRDITVYLWGSFNDWADGSLMTVTENGIVSIELTLEEGTYYFKLKNLDDWYGNSGVIEDTTLATSQVGWEMYTDAADCILEVSGGKYTFNFNVATSMLEVIYVPVEYTVTFVDMNGETISEQKVKLGAAAVAPEAPEVEGYIFTSWDIDFSDIKADTVVTATYVDASTKYTVTFVDFDGTVLSTQEVSHGNSAEAPADPEREFYLFDGWDKDFSNITEDLTVTAKYIDSRVYLAGSFNEWGKNTIMTESEADYTVSATVELAAGEYEFQIVYLEKWFGNTGTIEDTTLKTSEIGWKMIEGSSNCKLIASGGKYTFNFRMDTGMLEIIYVPITYTVTFLDWDGTVLKTDTVIMGKDAVAPADPTRTGYVFMGWNKSFNNIQADTEITATYLMDAVTYTVTFLDWNGKVINTQIVTTGEAATAPKAPKRDGYAFTGWDKDFSCITYNLYVTAQYTDIRYYLYGSFNNWATDEYMTSADEADIVTKTITLEAGTYTFKLYQSSKWFGNEGVIEDTTLATSAVGWEMVDGATDCTLKATGGKYTFNFNTKTNFLEILYTPIEYKVTFVDYDGRVISEQKVALGETVVAPTAPTREGYIFAGWDVDFSEIKADTVVTAQYVEEEIEYTVTFVDWDGTVISTQQVGHGKFATPPASPEREGYIFIGWDKNFREVTSDLTITAKYMETNVYLSGEFNDWNEEVAMTVTEDGETYTYEVTIPKGEYEFKIIAYETWYGNEGVIEDTTVTSSEIGWAMLGYANNCGFKASGGKYVFNFNIHTAMLEILYTPIEYTVTFVDMDGETISEQKVNLGAAAEAPEAPAVEGYIFTGWDTEFTNVKADTVVSPVYIVDTTTFTVTFVDYDGTVLSTQQIEYNKSAEKPEDPTRVGYIFLGWDKAFDKITADLTVTAQYKDNQIYLTGSFNNWDKKLFLEREGETSVFSTRIAFTEGTYYFKLYQNDVWYSNASTIIDTTDVTADTGIDLRPEDYLGDTILNASGGTYTFKFDTLTNKLIVLYSEEFVTYTVTFVDWDGTVLSEQTVNINNAAVAPEVPVREGDAQYTYTFKEWDVDFSRVTADMTVTATYVQTVNVYTVTFVDEDGTVLKTEEVEYGMAATAPEVAEKEGFFFDGWDKDFSAVTEDMTVTVQYISESDRVASNVTIAGTFNGWDASATPFYTTSDDDKVTVDMTLEAGSYEFKVVIDGGNWFGFDGTITDVTYGTGCIMSNYAGNCKLEATGGTYTFTYYKSTNTLTVAFDGEIDEDVVLYTVTFVDTDGTVIAEVVVVSGTSASAPAAPSKDGYVFTGWDKDFSAVTEDMTVTAKYIAGSYSNVGIAGDFNGWNSGANTFIKPSSGGLLTMTMNIAAGTYKFKVVDDGNWLGNGGVIIDTNIATSTDAGWEFYGDAGDCTLVASGGEYTFKYDSATHTLQILFDGESNAELPTFTVKFIDWDGTILKSQKVQIGSAATAPANPTRSGYKFTGWSCDFGYVTSDLDVYAHYMDNSVYLMGIKDWETGTRMSHVSGNTYRVSLTLSAGEYGFKVKHGDNWYGNNGWIEDTTDYTSETGWEFTGDAGNCTLKAIGSTYTFTFNTSTRMMKVTYVAPTYTVTFRNWDGTILSTQYVKRGSAAVAPSAPSKTGYVFSGWDRDFSWIYENTEVKAVFAENKVNLMGDFNSWSGTPMTNTDGGSVYSVTIDLAAGKYGFKIKHADFWYGNSGTVTDETTGLGMSTEVGDNCTFVATGGTYTFTYDTDTKKLIVTHDSTEMTGGSTVITNINLMGDFNQWAGTPMTNMFGTVYTATLDLAAGTYGLKVKIGESWYGNSGTIEDTTATTSETGWEMSTDVGDNCTLKATGGTYVFNYDVATNKLIILYGDAIEDEAGVSLMGSFNEWLGAEMTTEDDIVYTISVELEEGTYKFKIKNGLSWLGCSGVIKDVTGEEGIMLSAEAGDCTFNALGGEYRITYNSLTNMLMVENLSIVEEATPDEATPDEIPTYEITVNTSDNFTIVTDADMSSVDEGSSISFTVDVKEGYILNAVVYNMTILTAKDGVFTIDNILSNGSIIVVVIEDKTYTKPMQFTVTFVDKDGNVLSTEVVKYGESATPPEYPVVEGYNFTGWDNDFDFVTMDMTIKATYKKISAPVVPATTGKLIIETSGGTGFTIAVNGGTARPQGSEYINNKMPIGAEVILVADTINGLTFLGWMNETGAVVSTSETFKFYTTGNDYYKAVYKTDVQSANVVIFKNSKAMGGNGQILDMQYYAAGDEITFPNAPTLTGYNFVGWSLTAEEIQAKLAAGEDVVVDATWEIAKTYVDVTVNGGTVSTPAQENGKYLAFNAVTVVANNAPAGQKFAYWTDAEGNIVSYKTTYKFYPAESVEITAVFVAEGAAVELKPLLTLSGNPTSFPNEEKITYTLAWDVDASIGTVTGVGVIIVDKADYNESTFVHGTTDSKVFDRSFANKVAQSGEYAPNKSASLYDHTYVAAMWIQYKDAVTGETVTVYSANIEVYKPAP